MKKGFTLVELLAVVAIISLLAIFTLPKVVEMFTGSTEEVFRSEAENFFKATTAAILKEQLAERTQRVNETYSSFGTVGHKTVATEGRELTYCVIVIENSIRQFEVSDGSFKIVFTGQDNIDMTMVNGAPIVEIESDSQKLKDCIKR